MSSDPLAAEQESIASGASAAARPAVSAIELKSLTPLPAFSEANFRIWKKTAKAYMRNQGLWTVVERGVASSGFLRSVIGDEDADDVDDDLESLGDDGAGSGAQGAPDAAEVQRSELAGMLILRTVTDCPAAAALIIDVPNENAKETWDRLVEEYEGTSAAAIHCLTVELTNIRQKKGESLSKYAARAKALAVSLKEAGKPLDDFSVRTAFLEGLQRDSANFVAAATAFGGKQSFKETMESAITWDKMTGSAGQGGARRGDEGESAQAHSAKVTSSSSNRKPFPFNCFNCGKKGHRADECKEPKKNGNAVSSGSGDKTCGFCKKAGHTEDECRTKKRVEAAKPKGQVSMLARVEQIQSAREHSGSGLRLKMALDSGASSHTVCSEVSLEEVSPCDDTRITVANGAVLEKPVSGSVSVEIDGVSVRLHNVLSHEEMHGNLLSVGAMCEKDVSAVVFTRDRALAMRAGSAFAQELAALMERYADSVVLECRVTQEHCLSVLESCCVCCLNN